MKVKFTFYDENHHLTHTEMTDICELDNIDKSVEGWEDEITNIIDDNADCLRQENDDPCQTDTEFIDGDPWEE